MHQYAWQPLSISNTSVAWQPSPAGIPTAPATATLTPGATSLRVTFTGPALITSTDTFAYKLYTLGATPQAVGDANGYVVPR